MPTAFDSLGPRRSDPVYLNWVRAGIAILIGAAEGTIANRARDAAIAGREAQLKELFGFDPPTPEEPPTVGTAEVPPPQMPPMWLADP